MHAFRQRFRIVDPFAGPGFAETMEIDQLHIQSADLFDGVEHVGLESQGRSEVGCRLIVASMAKINRPRPSALTGASVFKCATKASTSASLECGAWKGPASDFTGSFGWADIDLEPP